MRSELEGRLMFAAPSELLIATPLSSYSERLLVRPCISAYVQHATNLTEPGLQFEAPCCVCPCMCSY